MSGLVVNEVAKTLDGSAAVLRGVSLRVGTGQCLGLRGATGSGKTTLLRIIAGLERPDRGEVHINDKLVASPKVHVPPGERGVGFVFQSLGLWPHLNVEEHLDYALSATKLSRADRLIRKQLLMDLFHLGRAVQRSADEREGLLSRVFRTLVPERERPIAKRRPAELSGGEKHLLAISRALCGQCSLLLLDEPFSGLDGQLKELVVETLARIAPERALTSLLVSHDPADFRALTSGVIHLREGRVLEPSASPTARGSDTREGTG